MKSNTQKITESIKGIIVSVAVVILSQAIAYMIRDGKSRYLNWISLLIMGIQLAVFIPSSGILGNEPTEKFFDITGSITYLITLGILVLNLKKISKRQMFVYIAAAIWCIRLGWFLFTRIQRNNGVDDRFTEMKQNPLVFLIVWTIQGLWVFLTLLSILIISQTEDIYGIKIVNYVGMIIWIVGFVIEVVADHQKAIFRSNPENRGKWISSGLWSRSRHPNYFGEIVMWIGISLVCIQDFKQYKKTLLLSISPIFVAFLLIFISGIPLLEKKANEKFGKNEEYKKYRERTPILIPRL